MNLNYYIWELLGRLDIYRTTAYKRTHSPANLCNTKDPFQQMYAIHQLFKGYPWHEPTPYKKSAEKINRICKEAINQISIINSSFAEGESSIKRSDGTDDATHVRFLYGQNYPLRYKLDFDKLWNETVKLPATVFRCLALNDTFPECKETMYERPCILVVDLDHLTCEKDVTDLHHDMCSFLRESNFVDSETKFSVGMKNDDLRAFFWLSVPTSEMVHVRVLDCKLSGVKIRSGHLRFTNLVFKNRTVVQELMKGFSEKYPQHKIDHQIYARLQLRCAGMMKYTGKDEPKVSLLYSSRQLNNGKLVGDFDLIGNEYMINECSLWNGDSSADEFYMAKNYDGYASFFKRNQIPRRQENCMLILNFAKPQGDITNNGRKRKAPSLSSDDGDGNDSDDGEQRKGHGIKKRILCSANNDYDMARMDVDEGYIDGDGRYNCMDIYNGIHRIPDDLRKEKIPRISARVFFDPEEIHKMIGNCELNIKKAETIQEYNDILYKLYIDVAFYVRQTHYSLVTEPKAILRLCKNREGRIDPKPISSPELWRDPLSTKVRDYAIKKKGGGMDTNRYITLEKVLGNASIVHQYQREVFDPRPLKDIKRSVVVEKNDEDEQQYDDIVNHRVINTYTPSKYDRENLKDYFKNGDDELERQVIYFLEFMYYQMCKGCFPSFYILLRFFRCLIATPWRLLGMVPVLCGTQGIGKTTVFSKILKPFHGSYYVSTNGNQTENLFGKHNELLPNKLLVNCDDMFQNRRNVEAENDTFKSLINGDMFNANPKHRPVISNIPVTFNFVLSQNNPEYLLDANGKENRRFALFLSYFETEDGEQEQAKKRGSEFHLWIRDRANLKKVVAYLLSSRELNCDPRSQDYLPPPDIEYLLKNSRRYNDSTIITDINPLISFLEWCSINHNAFIYDDNGEITRPVFLQTIQLTTLYDVYVTSYKPQNQTYEPLTLEMFAVYLIQLHRFGFIRVVENQDASSIYDELVCVFCPEENLPKQVSVSHLKKEYGFTVTVDDDDLEEIQRDFQKEFRSSHEIMKEFLMEGKNFKRKWSDCIDKSNRLEIMPLNIPLRFEGINEKNYVSKIRKRHSNVNVNDDDNVDINDNRNSEDEVMSDTSCASDLESELLYGNDDSSGEEDDGDI
jgi:Family of unknown function (DUF5906)